MQNNIIGNVYGRLTVIEETNERRNKKIVVRCRCECGNENFLVSNRAIVSGNTKSCGCIRKEKPNHVTHGLRRHSLYSVWTGIRQRCYYENAINYNDYGGRGIRVCKQWKDYFKSFYDWCIENGWRKGLDVDRKNNNGNYTPSNCRFVTRKINTRNTRRTLFIEHNGIKKPLADWADELGLRYETLSQRIFKLKMPISEALVSDKIKRRFHKKE